MKLKKLLAPVFLLAALSGCASVPMESPELDMKAKTFSQPTSDKAGVYIYRDSMLGSALTKLIKIDGQVIGATAPGMYFYIQAKPGKRTFSTQSEFSDNTLEVNLDGGKNYFIRNYIKLGVFVGGANLELVDEAEAQKAITENCKLATPTGGKDIY